MRIYLMGLHRRDCRWSKDVGRRFYRLVHPRIGTDEMATTTDIAGIKTHALHRQPTSYLPTRLRHKVPGSDYGNNPFSTIEILP